MSCHKDILLSSSSTSSQNTLTSKAQSSSNQPSPRSNEVAKKTPRATPAVLTQFDHCTITKACGVTARDSLRQYSTSVDRGGIKSCVRIRPGLSTTCPDGSDLFVKEELRCTCVSPQSSRHPRERNISRRPSLHLDIPHQH